MVARTLAVFLAAFLLTAPDAHAANRKPALQLLQSLPVSAEVASGYDRDQVPHWIDQPDGCTTRQAVLVAERTSGRVVGCTVVGGHWTSSYDGATTADPGAFDIDHMVPLREAWDSGAWRWTTATRRAYANDLGYAHSLVAVSASANRSKSDRDPADWLPRRGRCTYAKAWVGVKYRWRLSVDAAEKRALTRVLRACPSAMAVPRLAPRTIAVDAARPGGSSPAEPPNPGPTAPASGGATDPRFDTCGAANAAGFGPYVSGQDAEYDWYIDRDRDGLACET